MVRKRRGNESPYFSGIVLPDLFTETVSIKDKKRAILSRNRKQGLAAERHYETRVWFSGYEVERTGRGHDYKLYKKDPFNGKRKFVGYREIKSSQTAPLSSLQIKNKKKRSNYKVIREDPGLF